MELEHKTIKRTILEMAVTEKHKMLTLLKLKQGYSSRAIIRILLDE